jgi:hypothetical protein
MRVGYMVPGINRDGQYAPPAFNNPAATVV